MVACSFTDSVRPTEPGEVPDGVGPGVSTADGGGATDAGTGLPCTSVVDTRGWGGDAYDGLVGAVPGVAPPAEPTGGLMGMAERAGP